MNIGLISFRRNGIAAGLEGSLRPNFSCERCGCGEWVTGASPSIIGISVMSYQKILIVLCATCHKQEHLR